MPFPVQAKAFSASNTFRDFGKRCDFRAAHHASRIRIFYAPVAIFARNSSLVLNFLRAAVSVSIASMGFKSTILQRSLRMASRFLAGKSFFSFARASGLSSIKSAAR